MFDWNPRLKNYGFWASLFALILIVVQQIAAKYGYAFDVQLYNDIVTLVLFVLSGLGIISNPTTTTTNWWSDDKPKDNN